MHVSASLLVTKSVRRILLNFRSHQSLVIPGWQCCMLHHLKHVLCNKAPADPGLGACRGHCHLEPKQKTERRFLSLFEVPFRRIAISNQIFCWSKYQISYCSSRSLQTIRINKNYFIFEANNGSNCRPTITQMRKSATVTWQNGPFNSWHRWHRIFFIGRLAEFENLRSSAAAALSSTWPPTHLRPGSWSGSTTSFSHIYIYIYC